MLNALAITVIGMGLVFLAILLLWGLMALLVRLTNPRQVGAAQETPAAVDATTAVVSQAGTFDARERTSDRQRRAAVAAVAAALALETHAPGSGRLAPSLEETPGAVSPWLVVNRTRRLERRTGVARRRGN